MTQQQLVTGIPASTRHNLIYRLGTPLRWWFTPRATTREDKFRERNLRLIAVLGMVYNLFSFGVGVAQGSTAVWWLSLDLLIYGIIIWSLVKGRITLAGIILSSYILFFAAVDTASDPISGPSLASFLINAMVFALILPRNKVLALMVVILVLVQNYHAVVYYSNGGEPLIGDSVITSMLYLNLIALSIGSMGYYLMNDYNAQRKELEELIVTLDERVEQRTEELGFALEQLEKALNKAIEADHIKSQFLASMSHELRTPLNAILSFSKYMRQGVFGPVNDEQIDYLDKTVNSGEHLLSLINDVLDVTKIQSGMLKLYVEDGFDVAAELANIATSAENMLAGKPVKVVTDFDASLTPITCDKRRVRQIFYNLVSNAIKFTEKGSVTLSARVRGGELLFAVADTGPGIAIEDQPVIFDPFVQTETGIQHAHGTGLGLPISLQLTEAHGGRLWVESAPGEGSTFYVTLPLKTKVSEEKMEFAV